MQGERTQRYGIAIFSTVAITPLSVIPVASKFISRGILACHRDIALFCAVPLVCHFVVTAVRRDGIAVFNRRLFGNGAGGELEITVAVAFHKVALFRGDKIFRFATQLLARFRLGDPDAPGYANGLVNGDRRSVYESKIVCYGNIIVQRAGGCGDNANIRLVLVSMYKGTSGQLQIADRPNRVKIALDLPAGNKDSRIAAAGGIDPISILTGNGPAVNVDPEKAGADTRVLYSVYG